jgi:hypothetical protein
LDVLVVNGEPAVLAVWVREHGVGAPSAQVQTVVHEAGVAVTDGCLASLLASTVTIAVDIAALGLAKPDRVASASVDVLDEAGPALLAVAAGVPLAARADTTGFDALMSSDRVTETVGQADIGFLVE